MTEILLTAEQVRALPELLRGLPTVERMRLSMDTSFCVALSGYRGGRRAIATRDGTVYRYEDGHRIKEFA